MAWGVDEAWDVQWSPHVSWVSKLKTHMLVTLVMLVIHETVFGVSIFWSNTMVFEISQNKTRNMGSEFDDEFGSSKTDNRLGHVRAAKVGVCGDSQPVPTCQVVSPQNTGGYGLFCLPAPRGSWAHLGLCSCHRQSVDRPKLSPPQSAWPHVTTLSLPRDTTKQTHSHLQLSLAAGLQLQCCLHLEAHKVEWSLLDLEDVCQALQVSGKVAPKTLGAFMARLRRYSFINLNRNSKRAVKTCTGWATQYCGVCCFAIGISSYPTKKWTNKLAIT